MGAGSKAKSFIVTFHLQGEEADSERFVTPVKLGSEHRQYFFRKMPSFTDRDMVWFYPFISQDGQSYGAAFRLNEVKTQELTAVTAANQGKLFGTRVVDAPLRAVMIDRPIQDGVVVVWDGLSQDHVKLIATQIPHVDQFRGNIPTLPTFEVSNNNQNNSGLEGGQPAVQQTQQRKNPFKFLAGKKKEPTITNPYASPSQ